MIELLFGAVSLVWLMEFLVYSSPASRQSEKVSFWYIFSAMLVAVAVILGVDMWKVEIPAVKWTGLFFYGVGVTLRLSGIMHLKEQFTRNVSVREGDHLVSSGPYRILRHPLYTGLLSIVIGFALSNGSLFGLLVGSVLIAASLIYRIKLEEAMLTSQYGDEYAQWCRIRYRLIPFLY
ncbi:hypothetical protein AAV35_012010 [Salimicrobium jeotgali]|uniref:Isoprenylcysteine carboxyl methyltransferase n=1 Tax=Salimicrobium jeotgali TaxID=1230341 RepID=K2G9U5_9BACI|nr:isoprenylcysteine carboxylmethyltransferase family protein [Salimicrobium jeotgali]AKG05807.2 hypothetical protein AAV35_012010 [Salimicrobium jeotgali]EKE31117.1 isoprenylcysteine carboxyl methyltransferase [Salimicrobium jeotgali]MBM7697279.1 protein-S-isoprenylcysteine O-methyltransferase Ste14 [Salimicrobium jeotgali]